MATSPNVVSNDSLSKDQSLFRELSLAYQKYGQEAGVKFKAFHDPSLPLFSAKSESERRAILNALAICVKICDAVKAEGHGMSDSPALIWRALMEFGLRPPSDLFSFIKPTSVIEVHSLEGIQIFRNFNFYRFCSYTIEELYSDSWELLFDRHDAPISAIIDFVMRCADGRVKNTQLTGIPLHVVGELFSENKNIVTLNMEFGAPLFDAFSSKPAATMMVETITPMEKDDRAPKRLSDFSARPIASESRLASSDKALPKAGDSPGQAAFVPREAQ